MNDKSQIERTLRNERGIALLVVLLVTALLIALIFEFAYATRISLNTAVNFRDSQRAYYLARSGIYAFIKYGPELRKYTPQGEWGLVPVISEGEIQVLFKWEDESGKIKIADVKKDTPSADPRTNPGPTLIVLRSLFENIKGIDTAVLDRIADPQSDISNMTLLSGLHQYMSNEDFIKVSDSLTMAPVSQNKLTININTASKDVLQSLGIDAMNAQRIIEERQDTPYIDDDLKMNGKLSSVISEQINNVNLQTYLTTKSAGYYTVSARATVGGYTKQIEAVVNGSNITYWRAL